MLPHLGMLSHGCPRSLQKALQDLEHQREVASQGSGNGTALAVGDHQTLVAS
jgi:hypothetical protein